MASKPKNDERRIIITCTVLSRGSKVAGGRPRSRCVGGVGDWEFEGTWTEWVSYRTGWRGMVAAALGFQTGVVSELVS